MSVQFVFFRAQYRLGLIAAAMAAIGLLLAGCNVIMPSPTPTISPTLTLTATPTVTPLPTATPTPLAPLAVLLAAPEADQERAKTLFSALNEPVTSAGLRWQVRPNLPPDVLESDLRLVVVLPPAPGLTETIQAAPDAQFLALDIPGLPAASNLSTVFSAGARPDQQGFLAGFIAAMLTPDYRVAVISISDDISALAARSGFYNGVEFYCGLCQPEYPPFYEYPLYVEMPAGSPTTDWQALAQFLLDRYVQTVFVVPGAGDEAMLKFLAESGVNIIGVGTPPAGLEQHWVVSFRSDPMPVVHALLPDLLAGKGGQNPVTPLQMMDVNPDLFSPGRQRLAEETLADLLAGFIDTGVDLATGEFKTYGP